LDFQIKAINYDDENKLGVVDRLVKKEIRLNTRLDLLADVVYSHGPLENIGGSTPKVGQEITYTVNLKLYNTTNNLKNVKFTAKLPVGVE
jgi:uncharacterized repeat protein (TIGR01451 family)